jgi:hypothetical protein
MFPKQTRSQSLLGLYLFRKNWTIQNPKLEHLVFATSTLGSHLIYFGSLMFFFPFHALNTLELQFFCVISFLGSSLKSPKPDYP